MNILLYAWLLNFYPGDLRREYGEEMKLVFADDLRCRGPLRVWWNALRDFLHVALPHTLSHPALRVPIIAAAFSMVSLTAELLTRCLTQLPPRFAVAATLLNFTLILLPCIVIFSCRGHAIISLDLKDH